jgi:hypothetical protein
MNHWSRNEIHDHNKTGKLYSVPGYKLLLLFCIHHFLEMGIVILKFMCRILTACAAEIHEKSFENGCKCTHLKWVLKLFRFLMNPRCAKVDTGQLSWYDWLRAVWSGFGGSIPGWSWKFFFPSPHPAQLWGPPNLLSYGYRGLFTPG